MLFEVSPRETPVGLEFHRRYLRATCSTVGRYFTETVRGGQFGELRRRGSLIDDEEQLAGLVFISDKGGRYRCYRARSAIVLSTWQSRPYSRVFSAREWNFATSTYARH